MRRKLSLLGISFILFGIACLTTGIGHDTPDFIYNLGLIMPIVGLVLTIFDFW